MSKRIALNAIIDNALKRAEVYKGKQSDYNAALHYHGYFTALKELNELEDKNTEVQTSFKLKEN